LNRRINEFIGLFMYIYIKSVRIKLLNELPWLIMWVVILIFQGYRYYQDHIITIFVYIRFCDFPAIFPTQ